MTAVTKNHLGIGLVNYRRDKSQEKTFHDAESERTDRQK